ncbi:MAG: hypothetical protein ABIN35_04495 [candidate division WOR-3 bacterium]
MILTNLALFIMLVLFIRDLLKIENSKKECEKLIKILEDTENKSDEIPEKLNDFLILNENGWIKNAKDLEEAILSLLKNITPKVEPNKLIMGGLLGTFLGLTIGFSQLRGTSLENNLYFNSLFNSALFAFVTSIAGLIFYFGEEILLRSYNEKEQQLSTFLKKYVLNNYPTVEISIQKAVKPIQSLVSNLSNLSSNFEPVINHLNQSILNFDSSIEKYKQIQDEYIKTSHGLKKSIEDLKIQYESILQFMNQSTLSMEDMLTFAKSVDNFSQKTNSIADNIRTLIQNFQGVKDLPEGINNSIQNLKEVFEQNIEKYSDTNKNLYENYNKELLKLFGENINYLKHLEKIDTYFQKENEREKLSEKLTQSFEQMFFYLKNLEYMKEYLPKDKIEEIKNKIEETMQINKSIDNKIPSYDNLVKEIIDIKEILSKNSNNIAYTNYPENFMNQLYKRIDELNSNIKQLNMSLNKNNSQTNKKRNTWNFFKVKK